LFPFWAFGLWFICYLIGSISFGQLLARRQGVDLTKHGSGNSGAANAARALGIKFGLLVLLLDALKGTAAVFLAYFALLPSVLLPATKIAFASAAILGHNYSIFRKFKGGKGIATSFGVLIALCPKVALMAFLLWLGLVGLTRYSSVGSLGASLAVPFLMVIYREPLINIVFAVVAGALAFHRHRNNIEKLWTGTELKID
jgi:glycerol-3-phosphate acyltransferase PlsY